MLYIYNIFIHKFPFLYGIKKGTYTNLLSRFDYHSLPIPWLSQQSFNFQEDYSTIMSSEQKMSELLKEMSLKFERLKCLYNLLQSEDNEVSTRAR